MNAYIEKLKAQFAARPVKCDCEGVDSVWELLYYYYTQDNPLENAVIRCQYKALDQILDKLTTAENDQVFYLTCDLCGEYARRAVREGLQVGARLVLELSDNDCETALINPVK